MRCEDVYRLFFRPGEVCEIRSYGLSRTNPAWEGFAAGEGLVSGYFDNAEDFGRAAEALDQAGARGVYFTLNPVIPDLLARCSNRLQAATAKSIATSDKDVACIRWLPLDFDPVRPKGISSTDAELEAACRLAAEVHDWLVGEMGFEPGVRAVSGNGAHLCMRLPDLPNTPESAELVRRAILAVKQRFENPKVEVDTKVGNPARIWRLYGTTARKGDHTPMRPHRRSRLWKNMGV